MERRTPSFTQETVVAGEPVETQVRVRASSSYVRLVMMGEAGWKSANYIMCNHIPPPILVLRLSCVLA